MKRLTPMEETMNALDAAKDIELPMDPAYYDALHSRIMAAVDRADQHRLQGRPPAPRPWYARPQDALRAHFKSWLTIGGGLSGFILVANVGSVVVAKTLHNERAARMDVATDSFDLSPQDQAGQISIQD